MLFFFFKYLQSSGINETSVRFSKCTSEQTQVDGGRANGKSQTEKAESLALRGWRDDGGRKEGEESASKHTDASQQLNGQRKEGKQRDKESEALLGTEHDSWSQPRR